VKKVSIKRTALAWYLSTEDRDLQIVLSELPAIPGILFEGNSCARIAISGGVHHALVGMAASTLVDGDEDALIEVLAQCTKPTPRAVCLYAEDPISGGILAVSRKNGRTRFGLPGGKIEPGETPLQALVREVKEETGLDVYDAHPFFEKLCWGSTCYVSTTFIGKVKGSISTNEPIDVKWVDMSVLLEGPFSDYNHRLFRKLGRLP